MKGNRSHAVPFGPLAAEIIERRLGGELIFPSQSNATKPFSNFSNAKRRLDQACGPLTHWTLHDLRRTFTTQLAGLGVAPHVCERILAHSGGAISGVAAIYNRHNYLPEMRNAIESWERRLQTLMQL
jgi:integrase